MSIDSNDCDRANEIVGEMQALIEELHKIFRQKGGVTYDRWKAYPYAHIKMALSDDHGYLGKNPYTAQEAVMDLDGDEDIDDDDDE